MENSSQSVKKVSHEAIVLRERLRKQIQEVESELKEAHERLEQSEYEKRKLLQRMSLLKLLDLDVFELEALNRIAAAPVPDPEDIKILDEIIMKFKQQP